MMNRKTRLISAFAMFFLTMQSANAFAEQSSKELKLNTREAFLEGQEPPTSFETTEIKKSSIREEGEESSSLSDESSSSVAQWFQNNWPYLVGGALLGGTIAFFAVDPDLGKTTQKEPQFHFKTTMP